MTLPATPTLDIDLFGSPATAAGKLKGSAARGRIGQGAGSAAVPFLVLPRLRASSSDPGARNPLPGATPAGQGEPVPPPSPPELPSSEPATFVPVAAMEDVLALRHRQIFAHGHTLDSDLALIARTGKRHAVAKLAGQSLHFAIEDMQFNKPRDQIRRRLVKAAALILAAIDAEDARKDPCDG